MGKVLFIIHDVYQDDNNLPLGAAYMGSILREAGHDVEAYCMDVFHYTNEQLAEHLDKNDYDIIGLGYMAARYKETIVELCKVINKHKKKAWLVIGGPGPSPIPKYMLKNTGAEIVAVGEAEGTIVELLEAKIGGTDLSKVKGIVYKDEEGYAVVNERMPPIKDLDSIPMPAWDLFPMERYSRCIRPFGFTEDVNSMAILSSRGCVNRCNFCYRMEKGIRFRSIENVMKEIKILYDKYDVRYFKFVDELFTFSRKRVFDFRDAVKKSGMKFFFSCGARVDIFDKELILALKEAGCHFIYFGMESSSQKVLDLMNKNTSAEQNLKVARLCKELGVNAGLNFLWGNKGDDRESLMGNIKIIKEFNNYAQIRTIRPPTPYPGSDLYYDAIQMKLLEGPDDFFESFKNSDLILCNFLDMELKEAYALLAEANRELIFDHFKNTTGDMAAAERLSQAFHDLYFKKNFKFRGARHYVNPDYKKYS